MSDERIEGLRLQLEVLDGKIADGESLGGWKVGLTSGRARNSMGEGFRPFGYILSSRIFESGATIELADMGTAGVENEICFTIGEPLSGEVSREKVIGAIAGVAPAFEINERRLAGAATTTERLADDLSQWGIVVGASRSLGEVDFEDIVVTLARDGETVETVGARGHIDDHFESIARLVAQLGRFGRTLDQGARVITGSFTRQSVAGLSRWSGDFGAQVGTVEVAFT